jgi:hypothetical protein
MRKEGQVSACFSFYSITYWCAFGMLEAGPAIGAAFYDFAFALSFIFFQLTNDYFLLL